MHIEKELQSIEDNIKKEEQLFTNYFNDGFLTRIEALNNLIKSNPALQVQVLFTGSYFNADRTYACYSKNIIAFREL